MPVRGEKSVARFKGRPDSKQAVGTNNIVLEDVGARAYGIGDRPANLLSCLDIITKSYQLDPKIANWIRTFRDEQVIASCRPCSPIVDVQNSEIEPRGPVE